MVTLRRGEDAGGHVKCWERFAEAAVDQPGLDLTVYFLGDDDTEERLGPATRYVTLRPRLGTDRFRLLRQGAGDTDLALRHRPLERRIRHHDVLHATDTFSFGRTARAVADGTGKPLIFSLHTHLPRFTRVYARGILRRALAGGLTGRLGLDHLVVDRLRVHEWAARLAARSVEATMRASRVILVSNARDRAWAERVVAGDRVGMLRRGIDRRRFNPHRGAGCVRAEYGLPERAPLVLFAGRVDDSKGVMLVGRAVERLRQDGVAAHLVLAGEGDREDDLDALLGPGVSSLGALPQRDLADVYAAADVFAFPSRTETVGNVVIEAMASGLPAVVAAGTACAERVADGGRTGAVDAGAIVVEPTPAAWAAALRPFLEDPERRRAAGAAARARIESGWPSWGDVLRDDLLPVWRASAGRGSGTGVDPGAGVGAVPHIDAT